MLVFKGYLRRLRGLIFSFRSALLKNDAVYYINGSDVLPPPLCAEEEERLLLRIENAEAQSQLIEHNLRLVVYVAKRFENTGATLEELISIGTVGLVKAVHSFDAEKNIKLATYASRCIENEILMFIRKSASYKKEISIDEPLSVDWDGNELLLSDILGSEADAVSGALEADEERAMLLSAVADLNPRERLIIEMRFGLDKRVAMTQKEVADALGISQSYISRLEKKIMLRLRKKIEEKI